MDWFQAPELSQLPVSYTVPFALGAFFIGGLVKGAMGLGMPVTVVSIMCLTTDVRTAAMLVIFPILVTNLWQCLRNASWLSVYRKYWRLTLSMTVLLLITTIVSIEVSIQLITLSAGLVVVVFACANLWLRPTLISHRADCKAQYLAGAATGILGGLSGLVVVPLAIYFTARNLDKETFIASTAPFFLLGGGLLFIGYFSGGLLTPRVMTESLWLVTPAVAGLVAGEKIRLYIPDKQFRRFVLVVFFVMGLNLVLRGLFY